MTIRAFSPEEAQQKLQSLPAATRDMIYSPEMEDALMAVGSKYHLHLDQVNTLEAESVAVMLGFTDPQDFPTVVSERLNIDAIQAQGIVADLNTSLFQKIQNSMKTAPSSPVSRTPQAPAPQVITKPEPVLPIAEKLLAGKTIIAPTPSTSPTVSPPASKTSYKADPYREPIE